MFLEAVWRQSVIHPFQSSGQGVDKAPSEDAALSLVMIQVHRQVWPVSHLKHIKFSGVNTILCYASLHLHIYASVLYKCICINATHSTQCIVTCACRVLFHVFREAFELWMQSHGAVSSSCNLKQWSPACSWCSAGIDCCVWHGAAFHRWAGAVRGAAHPQLPAHALPSVTAFQ